MIECDIAVNAEVENVAIPPLSVPVPRVVAPSLKVTVPVASEGSVAVNITELPKLDGFSEDARLMLGAVLPTVCVTAVEVTVL